MRDFIRMSVCSDCAIVASNGDDSGVGPQWSRFNFEQSGVWHVDDDTDGSFCRSRCDACLTTLAGQRFDAVQWVEDEPNVTVPHVDYPHEPGYLYDCAACESACHCAPGASECVFSGEHNGAAHDSCVGEHCQRCGVCTMRGNGDLCDDCRDDQESEDRVSLVKSCPWPYSREDVGMGALRSRGPVELDVMHPWHREEWRGLVESFEASRARLWALCMWSRLYGNKAHGGILTAALHRIEDALDGGARNVVELRETYGAANLVASYIRDCLVVGGEPVLLTDDGVQVLALSGSGNGLVTVTLRLVDGQLATEQRFARSLVIIT